jgi:hypothetical protein
MNIVNAMTNELCPVKLDSDTAQILQDGLSYVLDHYSTTESVHRQVPFLMQCACIGENTPMPEISGYSWGNFTSFMMLVFAHARNPDLSTPLDQEIRDMLNDLHFYPDFIDQSFPLAGP